MENLERRVSSHLWRWLELRRSLSSLALYGNTNKLQLPFKSLEEEFKVTRAREVVQYRDSRDPKVAKAGIQVRTGRKWMAEVADQEVEARMRQRSMVGVVTRGRAGIGSFPTPQMNSCGKEGCRLVQEEVRAAVEETRMVKAVGMKQKGAWTRWENTFERKATWADLWKAEPHSIPHPGGIGCASKPIKPEHMGLSRDTSMPVVFQARNPGTHPQMLHQGTWRWMVPLEA